MSHAPRRMWSKRVGSKLYSSIGRPDDRVEPDVGHHLAVEEPCLDAVDVDDTRRAIGELRGHAPFERVRRLDDVVVARDHQVTPLGARRVGQQRHLALDVAGEVGVRGEFFE